MPRVHQARAAKDYPEHGIKKGDTYYHWAFFRGRKQMSKTPPRRSQTTASPNLSDAYAAEESIQDAIADAKTVEDVKTALEEGVGALEEVLSDFQETINNLEEAFQNGCPALEEKQEQHDAVETFKDELDEAMNSVDSMDLTEHLDEAVRREKWTKALEAEHDGDEDWSIDDEEEDFMPESVEWDDLTAEEQTEALAEALEFAQSPSLGI